MSWCVETTRRLRLLLSHTRRSYSKINTSQCHLWSQLVTGLIQTYRWFVAEIKSVTIYGEVRDKSCRVTCNVNWALLSTSTIFRISHFLYAMKCDAYCECTHRNFPTCPLLISVVFLWYRDAVFTARRTLDSWQMLISRPEPERISIAQHQQLKYTQTDVHICNLNSYLRRLLVRRTSNHCYWHRPSLYSSIITFGQFNHTAAWIVLW